jgi:hypothetical protein
MPSFTIPAMKQPEFQIVSKKAKISRGTNWSTDGNTAKVTISHSEFWPVSLSLSLSLSVVFVSLSLLGSYGIFIQPAMLEVKTRIKNNSSSSSLRGRQLTSQRNKLTPSLRSTNNWGFLHHFLLQKHREKQKKKDKTHISSTQEQKLNYWTLLSLAPLPPPPPAAPPSSSSSSYPVCWKTLKTRGHKRNCGQWGKGI